MNVLELNVMFIAIYKLGVNTYTLNRQQKRIF